MITIIVEDSAGATFTLTQDDNIPVETLAAGTLHHLRSDGQARLIKSVTFPKTSTTNVIKILPKSPETKVDTQGFTFPIEETTEPQGNPEGRKLNCPQDPNSKNDYTQTRFVVTPPDAANFGHDPDEVSRLERELRSRPFIKLTVTVKHA